MRAAIPEVTARVWSRRGEPSRQLGYFARHASSRMALAVHVIVNDVLETTPA